MPFTVKGVTYIKPVACCGFCGTPVFILHPNAHPEERIFESLMKSEPIPPQPVPEARQVARCATCGKSWDWHTFTLKEGEQLGTRSTNRTL